MAARILKKLSASGKLRKLHPENSVKCKFLLKTILGKETTLDDIKKTKGLYAFWLIKEKESNFKELTFDVKIHSKQSEKEPYPISWNWNYNERFIPLYIGKSTIMGERIRQHFGAVSVIDWFENASDDNVFYKRKSTTSQFRAGIEQLLRYSDLRVAIIEAKQNALDYFAEKIIITYIKEESVSERFYQETLAIGLLKPWFNIDGER